MCASHIPPVVPEVPAPRFVRPLSPEDLNILALENDVVAGHTCKVVILGGRIDLDRLRESIASRLHQAPELCASLRDVDGVACWGSDGHVDVTEQVAECDIASPLDDCGLRATVADIFQQRLDRSRPLWRIDVVPELVGVGSALIWRIHHALADGSTAMKLAGAALWDEAPLAATQGTDRSTEAHTDAPPPPPRPPVRSTHSGVFAMARATPRPWRRSPFDGHIDARRSVAFATVELRGLHRAAAAADGATVNDAVLTVVAGGLRRWLEAHHGHLGSVRVKVPVSLHGMSAEPRDATLEPGNRDSFFCLDLPLGPLDPIVRLSAIQHATSIRKRDHDAERLDALMRELGRASPRLRRFADRVLTHPRSFALNVSNVHGPRQAVAVLGAPVQALYSIAEIRERHALRVAVASLGDTLSFGLCADPTLLPDVDRLAREMQVEAAELVAHALRE